MCQITLGRIVVAARKNQGLSQRELAQLITNTMVHRISAAIRTIPDSNQYELAQLAKFKFDFSSLSKIENDRLDVRDRCYDWFIQTFCELFGIDRAWIEQIRQQTNPQPLDLNFAVFPVYMKDLI